ncbi:MAG TPA: type VII secretion integral membrane protein EccD [Micromonosporaceae bacterium]
MTVVGPATRVDLAIPDDVPLANLMPTLLRYVGEHLADDGATQGGWLLTRLGGQAVDSGRTAAQLDIRDGELLYLKPFGDGSGDLVFDDVADAVATATEQRPGRWRVEDTRRFALWSAAAALLAGAFALLMVGGRTVVSGAVSLGVGLALIVVSAVLSRAFGERRSSRTLALVALPYALVGGVLLFAGHRTATSLGAPHLLIGASAFIVYSAIATLAIGRASGVFIGAGGAGFALGLGAAISLVFGARPAASAAIVAAVAFALIPALPMVAYRLARAPVPAVPRGPDDLKSNTEIVDGVRVQALADRADEILTGLLGTVAVVLLGAEVVLAVDFRATSLALCGLLAVLVLLRARPYSGWRQRLPLLIVGSVGFGLFALSAFVVGGATVRLAVLPVALLVVATLTLVYGLVVAGRRISPVWPRTLDIVEIVLIVALVPMTAWVAGAFAWIRTIRG